MSTLVHPAAAPFVPPADAEILESISDAFVALDKQWRYVYVNARAAQLFGRRREDLVGKHIWTEFPEGKGEPFHAAYERAMAEQTFIEIEAYYAPYDRWFENRIYPTAHGLSIFFHDITARKRAEAALRESETRLRALADELRSREAQLTLVFDNTSEVLFLLDVEEGDRFRFASVNRAFVRATGIDAAQVVGRRVDEVIPAPARGQVLARYREAIERRRPVHWEEVSEYPTGTKHGEVTVAPVIDAQGRCAQLVGTVHDITGRKTAERELQASYQRMQSLSRQLVELQDAEHRRLSAELHDRIGQNLTALSINLNIIGSRGAGDTEEAAAARLADSRALLAATIGSVRDLITELRPVVLDDYGLLAGLRWYAEGVAKRTGVEMVVRGDDAAPRLAQRVEGPLFRIAQEAVTNALKHAAPKRVTLGLTIDSTCATLTIADDGTGFDPARATPEDALAHLGLGLMRERAEAAGGVLAIDAAPGRGTRVVVIVGGAA